MPLRIAVIAEADADRRIACDLIDRKIVDHVAGDWTGRELDAAREYCGLTPESDFTRWRDLRQLPGPRGALRTSGFIGFGGKSKPHFDYPLGSKALKLAVLLKPAVQAVVLVRDMDQQPVERRKSLVAAQEEIPADLMKVVLALPNAKREAWVLNGFEPRNGNERKALEAVRAELSFDPCAAAEKLDAMKHGAVRDAKRVLECLIRGNGVREEACWSEAPWDLLRQRGAGSGLTQFLAEVEGHLLPRIAETR